jgi:hypothetical protein
MARAAIEERMPWLHGPIPCAPSLAFAQHSTRHMPSTFEAARPPGALPTHLRPAALLGSILDAITQAKQGCIGSQCNAAIGAAAGSFLALHGALQDLEGS